MESGLRTVLKLLGEESGAPADAEEEDDENDDESPSPPANGSASAASDFHNFSADEIASLQRVRDLLRQGGNRDPKLETVLGYLLGLRNDVSSRWADLGCILFSQYYDTVRWFGAELAKNEAFSNQDIGLYAGKSRSGFWRAGQFIRCERDVLKKRVRDGELKILFGTDAASEGLNLQRLGTLINIDLPWNPTRLEQRKGRIQRIGQIREEIWIANLRYRGSVEDRVHNLLSTRLEAIHNLFGQIPDTLEDVWVQIAEHNEEKANELIDRTSLTQNPFDIKYSKVEDAQWESCTTVLNAFSKGELLRKPWH
jgi:ERCC4-related helicase